MCDDKVIRIFMNEDEKHTIYENSRAISADKIYGIIDYNPENHYSVLSENNAGVDKLVLDFFTDLFKEIIEKVNEIRL